MSEAAGSAIRIGISSCLLGERVRYDGGHKRAGYLVETLGRFVEWVGVCPEVEMGLGTPRETLRLVRIGENIRMVMPKTGVDRAVDVGDRGRTHLHANLCTARVRHQSKSRRPWEAGLRCAL